MAIKRFLSALMVVLVLISTLCAFKPIEAKIEPLSTTESLPNYGVWLDLTYLFDDATLTVHYADGTMVFGGATHGDNIYIEPYDLDNDPVSGGIVLKPLFSERSGLYYYYIDFACDMNNSRVAVVDDGTVVNSYSASTSQIEIDYDKSYDIRFISGSNTINYSTGVMIYFLPSGYDTGYSVGYEAGYTNGQLAGYESGYQDALKKNAEAYDNGRAEGIASGFYGLFTDPIGALFNFVIVPLPDGGGITLGTIFLVMIAISLIVIYLKYFAGG